MSASAAFTLEQCLARVASIVGPEHAAVRGDAIAAAPADACQIAEVLRFAQAGGLPVTPAGGGTKLDWGNRVAPGILLSLQRLNALRDHAWQDMTCTVEAGLTWAAMQAELARHGQTVALDPLWPERATVGGVVAVNDSGALRLKFGGLRDLIIGMTIVLADGAIAKTGGKVVKNVAGYDLHKLMTGSFGTLGVITQVNFRLHPVEEHARTWTVAAQDDAGDFAEPLRALMDAQMTPSCVQLRTSSKESALDIRVAGVRECLDEDAARIQKIFGRLAIAESGSRVWQARQQLFDKEYVVKVSVLPSELCAISSDLQRCGTEVRTAGQATGLMTVGFDAVPDAAIALVEQLRVRTGRRGGSAVVLRAPTAVRDIVDRWGSAPAALPLMREIKRRFDPQRTLNPGRFVGSI